MSIEDGPVTMSAKRYRELLEAERLLEALEAVGVDNWEGYSDAYRIFEGEDPDDFV